LLPKVSNWFTIEDNPEEVEYRNGEDHGNSRQDAPALPRELEEPEKREAEGDLDKPRSSDPQELPREATLVWISR
jgi:hypothetical protein